MTCIPIHDGIVCVGNDLVEIEYLGKTYLFEWSNGCGWMSVNKDGSERLSLVPAWVSQRLEMM